MTVSVVEQRTATIEGMTDPDCEQKIEAVLTDLSCVLRVRADAESETVELLLTDSHTPEDLRTAVQQAGFDFLE